MGQGKQAKILSESQVVGILNFLASSKHARRDKVMFLLSVKAGLRAKEISSLTWGMVTDPEGRIADCIQLPNTASKGSSGRTIPMHKSLIEALTEFKGRNTKEPADCIIYSERGDKIRANSVVNWFKRLYSSLGFDGCSSHSGRRTFITNAGRKASLVGASLRDVQQLAGHSSLQTTQRYMEGDSEAKRKLIGLI